MTHSLELFGTGPGRYLQRYSVAWLLRGTVEGECSALGGEHLRIQFDGRMRVSLLGLTLWSRPLDPRSNDLDHALQPTFVDGDTLVVRSAAVCAGPSRVLRSERIYVLRRARHAYWQPPPEEEPAMPSWLPEA